MGDFKIFYALKNRNTLKSLLETAKLWGGIQIFSNLNKIPGFNLHPFQLTLLVRILTIQIQI